MILMVFPCVGSGTDDEKSFSSNAMPATTVEDTSLFENVLIWLPRYREISFIIAVIL